MPRVTSDSHFSVPTPETPHICIPSVANAPVSHMIEDAEAYHITLPNSPRPSPPMSPSRSPRRRASPLPTPRPSPSFNPEPATTVSFSEYVASELARDQTAQLDLGVSFAPAARLERTPISTAQRPAPDPFDSDSDGAVPPTLVEPAADIPRSETEPNLHIQKHSTESETSTPSAPQYSAPTGIPAIGYSNAPSKSRYAELDCIQIDAQGNVTERKMKRADILYEARSSLPGSQPSRYIVNKWLNNATQAPPSPELKQFSSLFETDAVTSRKSAQKALRDYLRNSLQARDIRQVDPAFAAKPALWVRHSAIVVSLEGLRAIILHNKMFLFDPSKEKTKHLEYTARQSIKARPDAENPQPFEFRALEGILIYLAISLETEFSKIKLQIEKYVNQMPNELTTKMLEELRLKKQQLNQFHSRANSVRTVLENLLDEDDEMASMYLTEKHISQNYARSALDHSEVETLLEAYLQAIDLHVNQASLLNDAIEDTEDLIMIHLDTLRNRLLSVELAMSVVSMMFGFGGVVAGVFGMNITIPLFESTASRYWFLVIVVIITITVVSVSWLVLVILRRRGLYSFY
ncbi:Magnesium transporter MRS2-1 [Gracilariopsis chorda]|uniref:Magnesium transporter n=1 Tax=Gracilariopsis chorda TaxID=448386 RepID=A0A2V3IYP1_9FLOR|nr:Magnesium transporter MRS2-1 [Gracilariopsis chorda]|eukprot:PXF47272.1 Magnesium transporter MRS2-1 [Gracilariopsis chorda]